MLDIQATNDRIEHMNNNNNKPTTDDSPSHSKKIFDKAEDLIKKGAVKGAKLYWNLLKGMVTELSKMTKELKEDLKASPLHPNKDKK